MNKNMKIRFIAKAHIYDQERFAVYVPKNVIDYYFPGINLNLFRNASWHNDSYFIRKSHEAKWEHLSGYLGYYGSRNTLRLVFNVRDSDRETIHGTLLEFCVELEIPKEYRTG